jgi:cytochrome c553
MNKLEIYNALIGYQNGTYGGKMKGIMKAQVNGMSKTKLKNLARYIDAL